MDGYPICKKCGMILLNEAENDAPNKFMCQDCGTINEIKNYVIFTNKSTSKNIERRIKNYQYDDTIYDDVVYTNDCKELHIRGSK